ncbi:MAG: hypothetical protein AAF721_19825 [Myxococcota bacterium]
MATHSKVRLSVDIDEARQAILDALPKDAIVREEDDGVGRFAGQRTLVIVGRRRDRLLMFHGTYGDIKRRFDDPHLDVVFDTSKSKLVAKLSREVEKPPSAVARAFDVVGYIATVAIVLVAYYTFRSIPIDTQRIGLVALGGGLAWAAIAHYMPKRADLSLYEIVDGALKPFAIAKKKKKKPADKAEADAEPEPDAEAEAERA